MRHSFSYENLREVMIHRADREGDTIAVLDVVKSGMIQTNVTNAYLYYRQNYIES